MSVSTLPDNEKGLPIPDSTELPKEPTNKISISPKNGHYITFVESHKYAVLTFLVILLAVVAYFGFGVFGKLESGGFNPPNSEDAITRFHYATRFVNPDPDMFIIIHHPSWIVSDRNYKQAYIDFESRLYKKYPEIFALISIFAYPSLNTSLVTSDLHTTYVSFRVPFSIQDSSSHNELTIAKLNEAASGSPLEIGFGGNYIANTFITATLAEDLVSAESVAAPILFVLAIIALEGFVAAFIPLIMAVWTILFSLGAFRILVINYKVSTYITNVLTAFGSGLAIDFSLFFHLRFSEEMKKHEKDPSFTTADALRITLATSGRTVLFSTILLTSSLLGALQFHEYYLTSMSLAVVFPALFAGLGALVLLPNIYLALGILVLYISDLSYLLHGNLRK